jgi:hypothetical protein
MNVRGQGSKLIYFCGMLYHSSILQILAATLAVTLITASAQNAEKKPNILVIFGDDVGQSNLST